MSRLLLLIAIVVVVYWLFRSYRKGNIPQSSNNPVTENMVRCAHCGVHLPKGESIVADGLTFCCAEHRDAYHP